MGKGHIAFYYRRLSAEDQRTFNRWLKANAIVGAMFLAGMIAMAVGSRSLGPGPHDPAVAGSKKPSETAMSQPRRKQNGVVTSREPKI